MAFKLNISEKGKAWKLNTEDEILVGKSIGDKLNGKDISADLEGYELEITGASDLAGFPHKKDVEGPELKKVLFTKLGWGMHKKPRREGKKKVQTPKGLRLRKTVRGKQISEKTIQVNFKVVKAGTKSLAEIFPDQNKAPQAAAAATEAPAQ
jgi:ribosomal protein S6E (S10)